MTAFGAVLGLGSQALFLEVITEKVGQRCSTSWLPSAFRYHCVAEPCTRSCPLPIIRNIESLAAVPARPGRESNWPGSIRPSPLPGVFARWTHRTNIIKDNVSARPSGSVTGLAACRHFRHTTVRRGGG